MTSLLFLRGILDFPSIYLPYIDIFAYKSIYLHYTDINHKHYYKIIFKKRQNLFILETFNLISE